MMDVDDEDDQDLNEHSDNEKVVALEEIALQHSFVGRFVYY